MYRYILGISLKAISCIFTLTDVLQNLIKKDFAQLSQSEAYEILRYLLVACGIHLDKKHTYLKYINHPSSKIPPSIKAGVEKFKMDILQGLKDTILKTKKELYLRKSDLIDPNNVKFLKCAVQLANVALNHQLEKFDFKFPTDVKLSKVKKSEFLNIFMDLKQQEVEIGKESKSITEILSRHQAMIEYMKKEISTLEAAKVSANNHIEKIIETCPDEIKGKTNHHDILLGWSEIVDNLHANNMVKLSRLKGFCNNLSDLCTFVTGDQEIMSIEINALPPTTIKFCEENNITVMNDDRISLFALVKILNMSIPPSTLLQQTSFVKLLELKAPTNNDDILFEKYRKTYDELKKVLKRNALNLERKVNSECVNYWITDFFITVPQLNFHKKISEINSVKSIPFIDYDILEKIQNQMY